MFRYLVTILLVIILSSIKAQFTINAGADITVCLSTSVTLGSTPTATGGVAPYSYTWSPSTFLNSTSIANPIASNINSDITYTLTVMSADSVIKKDEIHLNLDKIFTFNAGIDTGFCETQSPGVIIGADFNNNLYHNFSWQPSSGLDNPTAPRPLATPTITTTYTLTVSDNLCPDNISYVTVTPFKPPFVDAGNDTTIDEGATITLHGTGATKFWWSPDYNIKYRNTYNPDVWPITTTTYTLLTIDQHGCYNGDVITINLIPGDKLFFYNTFTPNGDGDNDVFYIGNLEKFPDNNLKIYNRYGKLIYSATNYDNLWNGKYMGNELPNGTYFYILNDGKGTQYKGSVTIIN